MRRSRRAPLARAIATSPPSVKTAGPRSAEDVDKALDALARELARVANPGPGYVEVDLIVGSNAISHGLGRAPLGVDVTPKQASTSFAWAYDWTQPTNPTPDRVAVIDVVGAPMTARVFFW